MSHSEQRGQEQDAAQAGIESRKPAHQAVVEAILSEVDCEQKMKPDAADVVEQMLADLAESDRRRNEAENQFEVMRKSQVALKHSNESLMTELHATREEQSELIRANIKKLRVSELLGPGVYV